MCQDTYVLLVAVSDTHRHVKSTAWPQGHPMPVFFCFVFIVVVVVVIVVVLGETVFLCTFRTCSVEQAGQPLPHEYCIKGMRRHHHTAN